MVESPGSPLSQLSSHGSSEFEEEIKNEEGDASIDPYASVPAAKRRRTGYTSYRSTPQYEEPTEGEISEDSEGSAPPSPPGPAMMVQEEDNSEQVTVCKWKNCDVGDLGNLDNLVQHLRDEHIEGSGALGQKGKRYVCEWEGCPRQDAAPTTAYAMRSHMRSHTKEKPFVCSVPECDKAFTRSDALVKHMRTVHETDAIKPIDPLQQKQQTASTIKPPKIKLNFKKGQAMANGHDPKDEPDAIENGTENVFAYPEDMNFTEEELAMPASELHRLLRRQLHWSEQEGERLHNEVAELEALRKKEWTDKELLLANIIEAELASAVHRNREAEEACVWEMVNHILPDHMMPISGEVPWYRAAPGSTS